MPGEKSTGSKSAAWQWQDETCRSDSAARVHLECVKNRYELEARLRARWRRTLSRLPQSRESHHLRLELRLSSRNIQPQPSPAQTLTLTSLSDVKSSAADCATGHKGLSSRASPSSPLRSQPQLYVPPAATTRRCESAIESSRLSAKRSLSSWDSSAMAPEIIRCNASLRASARQSVSFATSGCSTARRERPSASSRPSKPACLPQSSKSS